MGWKKINKQKKKQKTLIIIFLYPHSPFMEKGLTDLAHSRFKPTSSTSQSKNDYGDQLMFSTRNVDCSTTTEIKEEDLTHRGKLFFEGYSEELKCPEIRRQP